MPFLKTGKPKIMNIGNQTEPSFNGNFLPGRMSQITFIADQEINRLLLFK